MTTFIELVQFRESTPASQWEAAFGGVELPRWWPVSFVKIPFHYWFVWTFGRPRALELLFLRFPGDACDRAVVEREIERMRREHNENYWLATAWDFDELYERDLALVAAWAARSEMAQMLNADRFPYKRVWIEYGPFGRVPDSAPLGGYWRNNDEAACRISGSAKACEAMRRIAKAATIVKYVP